MARTSNGSTTHIDEAGISMKHVCYLALAATFSIFAACADDDSDMPPPPATDGGVDAGTDAGPSVQIQGLTAPVHVEYDEFGFPHLHGKTDADVFAALGYTHAANRFFLMDFVRRAVRGTLGQLMLAPGVVDTDVTSRTFFATRNGDPLPEKLVSQLDDVSRSYFTAYAAGVNAWLADVRAGRNGATLTEEYSLPVIAPGLLTDWALEDSAAVALYMLNNLSNNADYEATLGRVATTVQALTPTQPNVAKTLSDLYLDLRPTFDAFTVPAATQAATPTSARLKLPPIGTPLPKQKTNVLPTKGTPTGLPSQTAEVRALLDTAAKRLAGIRRLDPNGDNFDHGSNNWVIGGSRTASGRPLLENDPHLTLSNPSIWFPAEIDAKSNGGTGSYHMAGGTFPGLPAILTGHNDDVAWGVTVTNWDLSDLYIETLTKGGTAVSFNGADVDIVTKQVDFFDQGNKVTKTLAWVPQHGPIIALNSPASGQAVTVRWVGLDGSTDAQAFLEVGRATNVAEVQQALRKITTAAQNFVAADKAGTIGWFPYAQVPARAWVNANDQSTWPIFPQPGNGTREWGAAPVPFEQLPQLTNPPRGAICTANQDLTGASADGNPFNDGHAATQAADAADGTRAEQIMRGLEAGGNAHTIDTIHALQSDTKSLIGERIAPRMVEAASRATNLDTQTQAVVAALNDWSTAGTFLCPSGINGVTPTDPKVTDAAVLRDSAGCMAFHVALYALFQGAFADEQNDPAVSPPGNPLVFDVLGEVKVMMRSFQSATQPADEPFWDNITTTGTTETRDEVVQAALTQAGQLLQAGRGGRDTWQWGAIHALTLQSPLASATPLFNNGPYATPGGLYTVNVGNPANVNLDAGTPAAALSFGQTSGPSIRTLIEIGTDRPHMQMAYPGGADLHRSSPFYNNMVPRWVRSEVVDFAYGAGAVANPTVRIVMTPAP
ncbi:penicillin acylase family protein [Labilithrix luteola]|uniref:penicillin acylase family protein n=1 Tax=Labilithrix luteola TaxID=1391654 RepID=UPI0014765017|nr:penicillin acylase family protein [Labilithrix luteola]